jgi:hypothetical protein
MALEWLHMPSLGSIEIARSSLSKATLSSIISDISACFPDFPTDETSVRKEKRK